MTLVASCGWMEWKWVIGVAPSLLTPAHFPVVFGAKKRAVVLLVGARLLACAVCIGVTLSPFMTFAVYFAPGILYALALYLFHFDDWARQPLGRELARGVGTGGSTLDVFCFCPWPARDSFYAGVYCLEHRGGVASACGCRAIGALRLFARVPVPDAHCTLR